MTADDISMALDWPSKKAGDLVDALLFSGYLEQDGDTYYIHDWYDYSGKLMDKREADKQRKSAERAARKAAKNEGQPAPCPTDVRRMSDGNPIVTVPNLTVPNRTYTVDDSNRLTEQRKNADAGTDIEAVLAELRDAWNDTGLGKIGSIDPYSARGAAVQMRLDRYGKEGILKAIRHCKESAFLRGDNKTGWRASFDWLIEETHLIKAMEGGYMDFKSLPKPETPQEGPKMSDYQHMQELLARMEGR
ncbi:MAG: hypothetical protein MJ074_10815 [Oscillospiraceae bacterium]|nr:hypothetical protein [Oscillospiraceae bacterium]